jgi:hypothetical protein
VRLVDVTNRFSRVPDFADGCSEIVKDLVDFADSEGRIDECAQSSVSLW